MMKRRGESGNVFFVLFGAVALVGVIGAATSTLMRGSLGTVVSLNQKAKVESQLQIARKLVALSAAQRVDGGGASYADCDGDMLIEPSGPDITGDCATLITGGGCLPASVGAAKIDPWRTMIGYCGWNHGIDVTSTVTSCADDASGGGLNAGETSAALARNKPVLAVISAGPDRIFQTQCLDSAGGYITPITTPNDDIVFEWTYDEAATGLGGGLWSLLSGDAITTDKDIEIGTNATFASGKQADFQGRANFGAGSTLDLSGGGLLNLPTWNGVTGPSCTGPNSGMLRIDITVGQTLQICDPTTMPGDPDGWIDIGGSGSSSSVDGADGDIQFNSNGTLGAVSALNWDGTNLRLGNPGTTNDMLEVAGSAGFGGIVTAEDEVQASLGSAADPSFTFIGQDTSGLYNVGGNVGISVGGTSRLLADTGGVGISGNLGVSANTSINGSLYVSSSSVLDDTLDVRGNIFNSVGSDVVIGDSFNVTGASNFDAAVTMDSTLDVNGAVSSAFFAVDGAGGDDGLNDDGSGGLILQTNGTGRLQIDSAGDIGIGLAGSPTTDLDIDGVVRLRQSSITAGDACPGLAGAVAYSSGDQLLVCSSTDLEYVVIGTNGGGGGGMVGLWQRLNGAVQPIAGQSVDDFLFGSYTLDADGTNDSRFFFDKSKGAFRAGTGTGSVWDDAQRGTGSTAFGIDTQAGGAASFAVGQDALVDNGADHSMAFGLGSASGSAPTVLSDNTLGIFMGDQSGVSLNFPNVMLLAGGSLVVDPDPTSAANITPDNGLAVDVQGNVGASNFCNEFGTQCFTAADIASGSTGAPGSDREIVFNSNGALWTNSYLVFASNGTLGINTNNPATLIHAVGGSLATVQVEGDESAASFLSLLSAGDGTSYLGQGTTKGWTIGAYGDSYGTPALQNSLMLSYWNGSAWVNTFYADSATNGIAINGATISDGSGSGGQLLKLDVTGAVGGNYYCDENGLNCFTAADIASGSTGAPGNDREMIFNSNGTLATDPQLVFTSMGRLGIGTTNPAIDIDVVRSNTQWTWIGSANTNAAGYGAGMGVAADTAHANMFAHSSTVGWNYWGYPAANAVIVNTENASRLMLGTDNASPLHLVTNQASRMYVSPTGQIMVGGDAPQTQLDIDGTIKIGWDSESCDAAREGAIHYNSTDNNFYVCKNAGAWDVLATGVQSAAAPDRGVQFNSGGSFTANANFVYTSAGLLTLGTPTADSSTMFTINAGANQNLINGYMNSNSTSGYYVFNANAGAQAYAVFEAENDVSAVVELGVGSSGTTANVYANRGYVWSGGPGSLGVSVVAEEAASDVRVFTGGATAAYERLRIDSAGLMGLDTTTPQTQLDVDGTIKIGWDSESCDAAREGAIHYNSSDNNFYVCKSAGSWDVLATGTPNAAAPDRGIQFNSGSSFSADANFVYTSAGRLGVGLSNPVTALEVAGTIKLAYGGEACDASHLGAIKYDSDNKFYGCGAGSVWSELGSTSDGTFIQLTDTPSSYTSAGQFVRINGTNDGLEFTDQIIESITGQPTPTGLLLDEVEDVNVATVNDGECLKYDSAGGNWVSGTCVGAGSGGLWTQGAGDDIYYNSGASPRVGIGTATPAEALDVVGKVKVSDSIILGGVSGGAMPNIMALNDLSNVSIVAPNDGECLKYDSASGYWGAGTCGSAGTPAGSDRQIQFNNGGAFGASDQFIFMSTGTLFIGSDTVANTSIEPRLSITNLDQNTAGGYAPGGQFIYQIVNPIANQAMGAAPTGRVIKGLESYVEIPNTSTHDINVIYAAQSGIDQMGTGNVGTLGGGYNRISNESASTNIGDMMGTYTYTGSEGGTVGNLYAYKGDTWVSAGTTTNMYGMYLYLGNTNNVVTNRYGLYIATPSGTTTGDDYGIYQQGAQQNVFNGNVGIKNTNPDVELDITGDIEYTGTLTDVSDMRLKTDIHPLSDRGSMLAKLGAVDTYSFRMKADEEGRIEFGVMAQELEKIFPELVNTAHDEMGTKSVNYIGLIGPMIQATQELKAENESLRNDVEALRAEREDMKVAINAMADDIKGLKAHTGYGVNRAELGLWMMLMVMGAGTFALVFGGIIRNRQRKAE